MTNTNTDMWNGGNRNTGFCNPGNGNTGDWNSGDWNGGDCNLGDRNPGNGNTGNGNSGSCNTGNGNTGDWNGGNGNTGYCNPGNRNAGNWNGGNGNTGDFNTGDCNPGYCNTITPEDILIFNKPAKRQDWIDAVKPDWMHVSLTKWIEEEDMTDTEKEAYPTYTTAGGYLKVYSSLKHAYIEAWEKASQEDRELTFKLPNFDPVVFEEIFGFNPCDCVEESASIKR